MSILRALREYLQQFQGMALLTDQTEDCPGSYALAPTGSGQILQDVIGNKTYQNSYVFNARECVSDEVDRQDNYDLLDALTQWLEEKNEAQELPVLPAPYQAEGLEVSNGLLMDVSEDGLGTYQVQIQFIFTRRRDLK